jgi:hypothetical protein
VAIFFFEMASLHSSSHHSLLFSCFDNFFSQF